MRSLVGDLVLVRLQEERDPLLHKRLYNALRRAILDGSLAPQSRLPPSRDLAGELGVSRNTILTTYEQLLAEGYVVSRRGSGTFVAQTAPESSLTAKGQQENSSIAAPTAHLSRRGQHLLGQVSASPRQWGAFIPGVPDVNAFPHPLFSKIQARISRRPKPERLSYSCNGGTPELQQALVDYLRVSRGVHCQSDQILITEGIHQAIDLVTRMLCDNGDLAWVEEPSYWGIRHVLAMNDVRAEPLTVDANGLCPPETVDDAPGVQPHRRRAERRFVQEIALAPLLKLHAGVERPFAREHNAARLHAKRRFRPLHAGELALLPGEQRFLLVLAVLSGRNELHGIGAVHALLHAGDRYDNVFHSHDIHSRHTGLPGIWFIDYMRKRLR